MLSLQDLDKASRLAAAWLTDTAQISESMDVRVGAFRTEYLSFDSSFTLGPYVWHHAEAIRALLAIYERTNELNWLESAKSAADYLRRIQCADGEVRGAFFEPWLNGSEPLIVDMNFESLRGLIDLHRITQDPIYLDMAIATADGFMETAYLGNGLHKARYFPDTRTYGGSITHMLEEGGFFMLHDLTDDAKYLETAEEQVDAIIQSMQSSGAFSCAADPSRKIWDGLPTGNTGSRIHYFHLAPILAAYHRFPKAQYLEAIERGACMMMDWQSPDGFIWNSYRPNGEPGETEHIDGAATAMFAMLWLSLHEITCRAEYLEASERALNWMIGAQYRDLENRDTFGAFFQERTLHEGTWYDYLRDISSSLGIIACEDYIRRFLT